MEGKRIIEGVTNITETGKKNCKEQTQVSGHVSPGGSAVSSYSAPELEAPGTAEHANC